jgi:uncharacterized membrane protein
MNSLNKLISYKMVIKLIDIYLFLSFSGCVMVVFRRVVFGSTGYRFLVWNLFLAWIPFVFSIIINYVYTFYKNSVSRAVYLLGLGCLWVAFYPNAPYIITDFIHLRGINFYFTELGYSMNFIIWYDFIMISLFILTGFLLGFVSLYMIQMVLEDRFNKYIGWIFVGGILFISSYAVYLGRFIRWNSWDIIFKPNILIKSILENFNQYAVEFTISFGLFLILIYCALYYLSNLNEYKVAFKARNRV